MDNSELNTRVLNDSVFNDIILNNIIAEESKRQYRISLHEVSIIIYDYFNYFEREKIVHIFGNYCIPLEIYFNEYINLVFLGNELTIEHINKIERRLKRLNFLFRSISSKIVKILENENKYKLVKKMYYNKIIKYILQISHNIYSFDNDTIRSYIDEFLKNY